MTTSVTTPPTPLPTEQRANPRLPSRPYLVSWRWAFDEASAPTKTDEVSATTAERAIAKVKKALAEEYAEAPAGLRILAAQPND